MDSRKNNPCFFLSLLLFLFFFFFSIKTHLSFAADTISEGESLTGNQTIISKDQNFALGFFTPGKSLNFYIGIWYNKISVEDKTVVWVANREKPIKDPTTAELRLLGNGNLVIIDQSQKNTIWSTDSTLNPLNSTEAVLGDDGNLVLRDGSKPSNVIWESFDNPTNTWLPGGKLRVNKRTKKRRLLTSWRNKEDPAPGIFSLEAEIDPTGSGQFSVQWNRSEKFWSSGDWNGQMFREVPEMRSNYMFNFSYNDEESYFTYTVYEKSVVTRFVMDVSGQIEQVTWLETTKQWNLFWSQPRASCDVYARCGSSGFCSQTTEQTCDCLPGFNPRFPKSWSLGDTTGGCVRNISLQCGRTSRFLLVPNTKMPRSSESFRSSFRSIEECQSSCSSLCYCNAYAYAYGSSECLLWGGDLLNLQQVLDGNNTGGDLYLKLAASEIQNAGGSMEKKKKISIDEKKGGNKIIIITTVLIGIVIISICTYFTWRWMAKHIGRKKKNSNILLFDVDNTCSESSDPNMLGDKPELKIFSFKELIIATNNFSESNKLGQGGFGLVYKGELPDGQVIAIKRLSKSSGQGLQEFKNEVVVISKLQHRNLVRLLGCCIAGEEKILIYEYMPNNSLDTYLFGSDPTKRGLLDWGKRFQIIEGISRGILYLHRDSRLKVIHRDLKPSNVLLDEELNPKISDFGMARIFGSNELQANTNRVVGTYGYMSPEYAMEGQFSEKSDVFSFGVLLLEIVSGRRNTSFYNHDQSLSLLKHAWLLWNENKIKSLIEPTLSSQPHLELEIVRCIHVGLLCVQEFSNDRPTMSTTLSMLTSEIATLPTPKQPAFTQRLPSSHSSSHEHKTVSVNTVTLTSVGGR